MSFKNNTQLLSSHILLEKMIMRNPFTLLLSTLVMVSGLQAEEASEKLDFKEIRLIPIGFQETILKNNDWKLIHTYPHKIAELHFFDGDKKIENGRNSLTSSRVEHVLFDVMSDGDLTTSTDWTQLSYPAAIHGAFKDYGHRMTYVFPQKATHAIIATPDPASLKGLILTLFQDENKFVDYDLGILAQAANSNLFKFDLITKEVTPLEVLPPEIKGCQKLNPANYLSGKLHTFDNPEARKAVKVQAGSDCQWSFKDGVARLDWNEGVTRKTGKMTGSMKLPEVLAAGQTLVLDIDAGYDTWQSKIILEINLGHSQFKLEDNKDFFIPSGDQYIAASSRGVGPIQYQLFLKRGKGSRADTITWAITGNGYNRAGTAELLAKDRKQSKLPVKLNLTRAWTWRWFNQPADDWEEGPCIDELAILAAGVGTMTKALPKLEKAHYFPKPDFAVNDYRKVNKELLTENLPDLEPYPSENPKAKDGRITKQELKTIKPWLEALPLPKSNAGLKMEWGEHGISRQIFKLLNASDDLDLLDLLLLRAEATMDWRNDSDKYKISFISDRLPDGQVLPYTWPSGPGRVYKNGVCHQTGDTWDYSSWVMYMFATDYIARHPELYRKKVRVGKDAGKMSYLQKASQLVDEAFLSIEQLVFMYSDPKTYTFDRPWNRYTTNILAFHHLHATFTALEQNKIKVDPARASAAQKAVTGFLTAFFDPNHFERYTEMVDGKEMEFMTFRYAASPLAPYEDKQHASAEISVLKDLYISGLYPTLFNEDDIDVFGSTIKHRLYKGRIAGREVFAATFGREPAMEHAGTREGLPYACLWTLKNDPTTYNKFEKMYVKENAKDWNAYVEALILRIDRQTFMQ